jgi:hypothetical protein
MPALVLITFATAIVIGLLLGGRFANLASTPIVGSPLAAAALGLLLAASLFPSGRALDLVIIAAANVLLGVFFVTNLRGHHGAFRVGLALIALGWVLNAVVIAANAGMPLSLAAYRASGQTRVVTPGERGFFKAVIADDKTHLPWGGDVISLRPIRRVVSAGDIAIVLGLGIAIVGAMRSRPGPTIPAADATAPHAPLGRGPVAPPPFG